MIHLCLIHSAPTTSAYKHTDNIYTDHALKALLVNFMVDVGGYGVLGLFVAYNLWYHPTWMAFFVGAVSVEIPRDLSPSRHFPSLTSAWITACPRPFRW